MYKKTKNGLNSGINLMEDVRRGEEKFSFSLTCIDEICAVRASVTTPRNPPTHRSHYPVACGCWNEIRERKRGEGEDGANVDFCFQLHPRGCDFHSKAEGRHKE